MACGVIGPVPQPKNILLSPIEAATAFSVSRVFVERTVRKVGFAVFDILRINLRPVVQGRRFVRERS